MEYLSRAPDEDAGQENEEGGPNHVLVISDCNGRCDFVSACIQQRGPFLACALIYRHLVVLVGVLEDAGGGGFSRVDESRRAVLVATDFVSACIQQQWSLFGAGIYELRKFAVAAAIS